MATARNALRDGLALRDANDVSGALARLTTAWDLVQTPVTGFELGKTHLMLGHVLQAHELFVKVGRMPAALEESSRSATARTEAGRLTDDLEPRIPSLRIRVKVPSGATAVLRVDDEIVAMTGAITPRAVDPGAHQIVARAGDGPEERVVVELKEGETKDVALEPKWVPPKVPVGARALRASDEPARGRRIRRRSCGPRPDDSRARSRRGRIGKDAITLRVRILSRQRRSKPARLCLGQRHRAAGLAARCRDLGDHHRRLRHHGRDHRYEAREGEAHRRRRPVRRSYGRRPHGAVLNMLWVRSLVCVIATAAVVVACSAWQIPSKRCRATELSGEDAAVATPATARCAACVNAQCCDAVGHCGETGGCNERVLAARSCLLAAGPTAAREEEACRKHLDNLPEPVAAYSCMREKCGQDCQIPSCDVSPAATAVVNGRCDRCVTASCCPQINFCYGDRGCKLVLECIFQSCKPELGKELLQDEQTGARINPCDDAIVGLDASAGPVGFKGCIADCINDFGRVQASFESACRAFSVFRCAAEAKCGNECLIDAGDDAADANAVDADLTDGKASDASGAADAPKD